MWQRNIGIGFTLVTTLFGCAMEHADVNDEEVVTTQSQLTDCRPAPNQVAFFVDPGFGGSCVNLGYGKYPNPSQFGLPNDSISSIMVGSDANVKVCKDSDWGGSCMYGGAADLPHMDAWDNVTSSLEVYPRSWDPWLKIPKSNQVAVFKDANYGGVSDLVGIGDYSYVWYMGIPNDSMSSIKLGEGVKVVLCKNGNFGPYCEEETKSQANLGYLAIGNDTVSSMRVQPLCQHDLCVQGAALPTSCVDACVRSICASDAYCCATYWDDLCVGEVQSICGRTCA